MSLRLVAAFVAVVAVSGGAAHLMARGEERVHQQFLDEMAARKCMHTGFAGARPRRVWSCPTTVGGLPAYQVELEP